MHSDYRLEPEIRPAPSTAKAKEAAVKMPHFDAAKTRAMTRLMDQAAEAVHDYIQKKGDSHRSNGISIPPLLSLNKDGRSKQMCTSGYAGGMSLKKIGALSTEWTCTKLLNNRIGIVKKKAL